MCFNEWADGCSIFVAIPTMTYSDSLSTWPPELIHPSHKAPYVALFPQSRLLSMRYFFLDDAAIGVGFFIYICIRLRVFVFSLFPLVCANQTAGFQETLTEVEILALIVGCVCHDLDHRGTNNAFQAK